MRLKNRSIVPYKGEVVDLCVEGSHTYNVEGIAVHNSGGGSLVAYVLHITDLDPIRWDLPFARFLSVYRKGSPDIDCVHEGHLVIMADRTTMRIGDIITGDVVLAGDGTPHRVLATYKRYLRDDESAVWVTVETPDGTAGNVLCVPRHKFVREDGEIAYCCDLRVGDRLMGSVPVTVVAIERGDHGSSFGTYVDITVEDDHRFHVVPFSAARTDDGGFRRSVPCEGVPNLDVVVHNTDLSNRDLVIDELREFFGYENVVPISTYGTFKLKTLVKDVGKFYGVPFDETNEATRTVESEVRKAITKHGDDKNLFVLTFDDAMAFHCVHAKEPDAKPICDGCTPKCTKPVSPSFRSFIERHPAIAESIRVLFKQNRNLGRHAGGVLIADDLPTKMPLVTSKGKGDTREPQSPWVEGVNWKHLEKVGNFIKYDLLGLETLRLIERAIELILTKQRRERGWFEFTLDDGSTVKRYGDAIVRTSNRGEVEVRDLKEGDDVVDWGDDA